MFENKFLFILIPYKIFKEVEGGFKEVEGGFKEVEGGFKEVEKGFKEVFDPYLPCSRRYSW